MTPFQTELINTYFTSMHFFRESDNTIQDAISVLGASIKKSKIKACSYHFALFKKNRRYAIFTDKIFYGQTIEGFIVSFNYTDITSVNNMSVVTKNRSYIFSKQISDQLLGIFLILNETTEGNTEKFDMFSVKSKRLQPIFGEILPCNFWGDIHDEIMRIPQYYPGPLAVLVLNSKLREVKNMNWIL